MAKYDVYENQDGQGYLLEVQSDLLEGLNTRIVVPLLLQHTAPKPARFLNPIFEVNNQQVVMETHLLAAVPLSILVSPVTELSQQFDEITRALDMLFQGF